MKDVVAWKATIIQLKTPSENSLKGYTMMTAEIFTVTFCFKGDREKSLL